MQLLKHCRFKSTCNRRWLVQFGVACFVINAIRIMQISISLAPETQHIDFHESFPDLRPVDLNNRKIKLKNKGNDNVVNFTTTIRAVIQNETAEFMKIPNSNGSLGQNYLLSRTLTDLYTQEPIKFMKEYDNPCFQENNTLHCLPYFFVAGFPKCGTTDMYTRLIQHKNIGTHHNKEIHWLYEACGNVKKDRGLLKELFSRKGRRRDYFLLKTYLSRFDECIPTLKNTTTSDGNSHPYILGDFSPSTVWNSPLFGTSNIHNADCVHKLVPNSKVIIMVRNPIDRLYSDYAYTRPKRTKIKRLRGDPEDFANRIKRTMKIWNHCVQKHGEERCVMDKLIVKPLPSLPGFVVGFYYLFIQRWLESHPSDLIHIVRFEDYVVNPNAYINSIILPFLGREPFSVTELSQLDEVQRTNQGPSFPRMLNSTYTLLTDFFRPFNQKLADLLKDDKFLWDPH